MKPFERSNGLDTALYRSFLKMLNIACSQNAKYFVRIVD